MIFLFRWLPLPAVSACASKTALLLLWSALMACGGGAADNSSAPASRANSSAPEASSKQSSSVTAPVNSSSSVPGISSAAPSSPALSSIAPSSASLASSSLASNIVLGGSITYDFIPQKINGQGLDYAQITVRPCRGVVVELLDENAAIIASSITNNEGGYSFEVARNRLVSVRVKAQLISRQAPTWDFKVTDNTRSNSVYAMAGSSLALTDATAQRNLHAPSGWSGTSYSESRVAAPFAIIDSIFTGVTRVVAAGNTRAFPPLELRWSAANTTADGDLALGEIATSFYSGDAIYILGAEDDDTDEYDSHVILHEWGHYLEAEFSRSDSIGGDHTTGDKLDMRVAMSEGFSNAFSAMMLDDPLYRDTSGVQQDSGFQIDVSRLNNTVRGWYAEASVQSVLYNFYTSNLNKTARDFSDIFRVISANDYVASDALQSIYVFAEQLRATIPAQTNFFDNLLSGQNIALTNQFGDGESNSGGYATVLPIYKTLSLDNSAINLCSSNKEGAYNKIGVSQFALLNVVSAGNYTFSAQETGTDSGASDPDVYLYRRGNLIALAEGSQVDSENLSHNLTRGIYILELVDARAADSENSDEVTACFAFSALRIN